MESDCVAGQPITGTRRLHGTPSGREICSGAACLEAKHKYLREYQRRRNEELEALRARVKELEAA